MKRDALVCDEHISSEALSSWRDGYPQGQDANWMRQHIATCRACQETLARFDEVTLVLRRQRELDPGDRIVRAMRDRASEPARRRSARSRRRWGGLAALASVAAVLLLFTGLFSYLSHVRDTGTIPTSKATPTATIPPIPTFDPNKEQFSPVVQAQDAWGTGAITAHLTNELDPTHYFWIYGLMPDGAKLYGAMFATDASGKPTGIPVPGLFDVATRQFTSIPVQNPSRFGARPNASDGRFVILTMLDDNIHTIAWVYDLSTGQTHPLNEEQRAGVLSSGRLIYTTFNDHSLHIMNLATGADQQVETAKPIAWISAFSWPNILYATQQTSKDPFSMRMRDLSSGQDIALPQLDSLAAHFNDSNPNYAPTFALTDDTIFANRITGRVSTSNVPPNNVTDSTAMSTLYELGHVFSGAAQLRIVGRYHGVVGDLIGANDRLVIYNFAAWDRAEWRFVKFSTLKDGDGPLAQLAGNTLLLYQQLATNTGADPEDMTLYDTTHLPVRGP